MFLTNRLWVFLGKKNHVSFWVEIKARMSMAESISAVYDVLEDIYNTITNLVSAPVVVLGVGTIHLAVRSDTTLVSQ